MRNDALGLFWEDKPAVRKPKAEKLKRQAPDPVWLAPDYLPGLEEALAFPVTMMQDWDFHQALMNREQFLLDVEVYSNYFLAVFTSFVTGKVCYFEMELGGSFDMNKMSWMMESFTTVGFNSLSYDCTMVALALAGKNCAQLKIATKMLIEEGMQPRDVLKHFKVKKPKNYDHIDLIEVAPLFASLKIYSGRLHAPKMQDLPFHPDTVLSKEQIAIVRYYCVNDTENTAWLRACLGEHLSLRETMSREYGTDLRSKSDAQIAEAVIAAEVEKLNGVRPQRPDIAVGTMYRFNVPHFIKFQTPLLNWALSVVANARFIVADTGSIGMPEEIKGLKLGIGQSVYRMGIGGLHSSEKSICHVSDSIYELIDRDVTSYYPFIILNQGLYPKHLGTNFLRVYRQIVERRIAAKARGDKVTADSLKITINGSYGKLGSPYSVLYAPDLLIQVTLTGQLSLLMLIERLELAGIPVVSANTDGIVFKRRRDSAEAVDAIIHQWEKDTGFETEETRYKAVYSRDVNNYLAIKRKFDKATKTWTDEADGVKTKGAYANPWNSKNLADRLHINPTGSIIVDAVQNYLVKGVPIEDTITTCRDITKFVYVRNVTGGAAKLWSKVEAPAHNSKEELVLAAGFRKETNYYIHDTIIEDGVHLAHDLNLAYELAMRTFVTEERVEYLGKAIRWYFAHGAGGEIVVAKNGNRVPKTDGAKPLMRLCDEFPDDVNFEYYIREAEDMLADIGYATV